MLAKPVATSITPGWAAWHWRTMASNASGPMEVAGRRMKSKAM